MDVTSAVRLPIPDILRWSFQENLSQCRPGHQVFVPCSAVGVDCNESQVTVILHVIHATGGLLHIAYVYKATGV